MEYSLLIPLTTPPDNVRSKQWNKLVPPKLFSLHIYFFLTTPTYIDSWHLHLSTCGDRRGTLAFFVIQLLLIYTFINNSNNTCSDNLIGVCSENHTSHLASQQQHFLVTPVDVVVWKEHCIHRSMTYTAWSWQTTNTYLLNGILFLLLFVKHQQWTQSGMVHKEQIN